MFEEQNSILEAYKNVHLTKKKGGLKKTLLKENETVGKHKTGDELEGKTKERIKNAGPENADGFEEAEEGPESLNPVKKSNKKESAMENLTFQDLYRQIIKEEDIESMSYDDEVGDFPEEGGEGLDDEFGDEELGGEEVTVTLSSDQAEALRAVVAQLDGGVEDEFGAEDDFGGDEFEDDMGMEDDMAGIPESRRLKVRARKLMEQAKRMARAARIVEMKSEPEPKPHSSNIKSLQHPRKLAGVGVKKAGGSASKKGSDKKRTGEIEDAPEGFKPADKSQMKVKGSGPAHGSPNASVLES